MMKKTHIVAGVSFGGIVAAVTGITITPIFILVAALGGLFPDIDHPSGSINQKILLVNNGLFKAITYIGVAALLYFYGGRYIDRKVVLFVVPILIAIGMSRHRSITHSLLAVVFIGAFLKYVNFKYGIDIVSAFTLGVISHIFIDMFNPQGVELLWPCKKNIAMPITVKTGGVAEKTIFYTLIAGSIFFIAKAYKIL